MMGGLIAAPAGWAAAGSLGAGGLAEGGIGAALVSNPVGWTILGATAIGLGGYGLWKLYQNAHTESQAKFQTRTIAQACSTCHDCNDLNNKINEGRDELKQRYDEMRDDDNDLYAARPGPIPGKEYLGTWPGHQTQFKQKQTNLRKLLNASSTAGCPPQDNDAWEWASKPTPTQPAP